MGEGGGWGGGYGRGMSHTVNFCCFGVEFPILSSRWPRCQ